MQVPNLIGGEERPAAGGAWLTRTSPADGAEVATFARSGSEDVDAAVSAALAAQPGWAAATPVERGRILRRAAELLRAHADELVSLVCAETGKPPRDSRAELGGAVEQAYFAAGEGQRLYGKTLTSGTPHRTVLQVRVPVGVAALIVSSNTPLPNYAWKVFPCLISGNAAVLKPSEDTPASAYRFAQLLLEAGVPGGALNVIQGYGAEAGAALVEHPQVDLVSFTGSCQVGRTVQTRAAGRLAKVSLELGGKNPFVVCDDADLERAADLAVASAFSNAGQRCAAGSRVIVFDGVYDAFRELLVKRTTALTVGTDDDADLGPVVNERQLSAMLDALEGARAAGATIVTGGERLSGDGYDGGCYLAPTIVEGAAPSDEISRSELFGPITSLYRVRDLEEALRVANDSPFGLTAAIWTSNVHRAMVFSHAVRAGVTNVNGPTFGSEPHMPFGGVNQSGNGTREPGTEALDVYTDWKNISIIHDPAAT